MSSRWISFALQLVCAIALGILLQPAGALAQTSSGAQPVESVLEWVEGILQGPIARSLAIIAVCFLGFLAMTGRLSWHLAGSIIIGIALVFGAERLVNSIEGSVGTN